MKHIEERGDSITSSLSDFSLFDESLVEECGGILLLGLFVLSIIAISLFLGGDGTRDVETHFDELIPASTGLLPLSTSTTKLAVGACIVGVLRQGHLDSDLIATGQIGVAYFGVWELESGLVLHAKGNLGLGKVGLAPIPATNGMFFVLEHCAVPVLEDLAEPVVIFLLEAIELNDTRIPL